MDIASRSFPDVVEYDSLSVTSTKTLFADLINVTTPDRMRLCQIDLLPGGGSTVTHYGKTSSTGIDFATDDAVESLKCLDAGSNFYVDTATTATLPVRLHYAVIS